MRRRVAHLERTAVHLHDGTAQRQPQTHAAFEVAAFPARLAGGTIVEQIEDVLAILLRNAGTSSATAMRTREPPPPNALRAPTP